MFAIVEMGGKQFKVEENQVIHVEKLPGNKGDIVPIENIMLFSDGQEVYFGKDIRSGINIKAEIIGQKRGPKLHVFKYKRRKGYRRKIGHRQYLTTLKITEIERK